jgi:hypothetical protein
LLSHLRTSITSCATFRRLVGADSAEEASDSVYDRDARDTFADDVDLEDPDRQPLDPYPRCILEDRFPQTTRVGGSLSTLAHGRLDLFIEFKQFSAEELSTWYSESIAEATDDDQFQHAKNLAIAIRDQLLALSQTAGCLVFNAITEDVLGLIDSKEMNGLKIWVIGFSLTWEGLP